MKSIYNAENHDGGFYVQADGASMNGGAADEDSTLDCILFAEELLKFSKSFGIKLMMKTIFQLLHMAPMQEKLSQIYLIVKL